MLGVVSVSLAASVQTPVLTRSYDNARTGSNTNEFTLTPPKVSGGMKKLTSLKVDDDPRLEAQPLYVPQLTMSDGKIHDVVFVATMANNVWAFDANDGSVIWKQHLAPGTRPGTPIKPGPDPHRPPPANELDMYWINILLGVLSTPVIDIDTKTMYLVTWSSPDMSRNDAANHLHALNLIDGSERHKPLLIQGQSDVTRPPKPPATFVSHHQKQRCALLLVPLRQTGTTLVKKTLFVASGQFGENLTDPHGWVFAFDPETFQQTAALCTMPNTGGGGSWQAAQGPSADDQGNVFVMTSNGGQDGKTDFAESFLRLNYTPPSGTTPGKLTVADWFTPFLDTERSGSEPGTGYNFQDQDLGSGAPVPPPGTKLLLGAGKDGILYVLDKNNLGKTRGDFTKLKQKPIFFTYFQNADATKIKVLDSNFGYKTYHLHGSPTFFENPTLGPMLFVWGENGALRAWTLDKISGKVTFFAQSREIASEGPGDLGGMPGGMLTLSAGGTTKDTGIVWTITPLKGPHDNGDANKEIVEGIVRAYDATNLDPDKNADGTPRLKLLWDSKRIAGNTFKFDKFNLPVVADGKVFVPTYDGWVDVYVTSH